MDRERIWNLIPFLLILLALVGFVLHRAGVWAPIEGVLAKVTTPLQEGASLAFSRFGELARTTRDLRDLRERNQELEAENAEIKARLAKLEEMLLK